MSECDIAIVGGGLVGAALAVALQAGAYRVSLFEASPPPPLPLDDSWDSRVYAITPGNAQFLQKIGAWGKLDPARVAPIDAMQVWGDQHHACLHLDAYEAGVPELGFIVESRRLLEALWGAMPTTERAYFKPKGLTRTEDAVLIDLEGQPQCRTALLVGADGGESWARAQAGIHVRAQPYGQLGVVANFAVEQPHRNIARQWFLPEGVLAWLPLPGNRISIVWSTSEPHAQRLLAMDSARLCDSVAKAGHHALGALNLLTPASAFPLALQQNAHLVSQRIALMGDAAHRAHPLAGQGVNLGFRDVRALSQLLLTDQRRDPGDQMLLRRYERARKADILGVQWVTDGLHWLFSHDQPLLGKLRNDGLRFVERVSPLKRGLISQAIV